MSAIYRNRILITNVCDVSKGYAFGVILSPEPRTAFFPQHVVRAFNITRDDEGDELDCLFIDEGHKRPTVLAVLEIGTIMQENEEIKNLGENATTENALEEIVGNYVQAKSTGII